MTVALIVAAGSGERLGADRPKALVELCGKPLLEWSVKALREVPAIEQIVVALPPQTHVFDDEGDGGAPLLGIEGGPVRSDSVRRALEASEAALGEIVLVHDAARPLLTPEIAGEVLGALERDPRADAAIAAAPMTDTVKRADRDDGVVTATLDRGELWAVQTPQVFRRAALARALAVAPEELARATDDAWLIERQGGRVLVVPTSAENLKVTTPHDLRVAELLLRERGQAP